MNRPGGNPVPAITDRGALPACPEGWVVRAFRVPALAFRGAFKGAFTGAATLAAGGDRHHIPGGAESLHLVRRDPIFSTQTNPAQRIR